MNRMAPIEHYSWTGWHGLAYAGAYAAGVLILLGWTVRGMIRLTRRLRRPAVAATSLREGPAERNPPDIPV